MRHRRHSSRLNRTTEHRTALMRNLSVALIDKEIIYTTTVKAKQARQYIERLITLAKKGLKANDDKGATLNARRLVFARLGNKKEATKKLFAEIAPRFSERNGGYTRVVKANKRLGDGAEMAYLEFVDRVAAVVTEAPAVEEKPAAAKTKKKATKKVADAPAAADPVEEKKEEETPVAEPSEEKKEEAPVADPVEEKKEEDTPAAQ